MKNYFPTGLAKGVAFCNRKQEIKRLTSAIHMMNPCLILSPRRYGKTSLALRVFEEVNWPYTHVDFYKAFNEEDIERFILEGISVLLSGLESKPERLLTLATDFFSSIQIHATLGPSGLRLTTLKKETKPAENILKALEKLHAFAKAKQKKVILYLDEFQVVGQISKHYAIEAAIREIAQKSEYIAFVFSGSDRHLIEELFNDKKRPFYHLCDIVHLHRISTEDYSKHLVKASTERWGRAIGPEVIDRIMSLTERHAYYFNKLCSLLWQNDDPDLASVERHWTGYVFENKTLIEREFSLLSKNELQLLVFIAQSKQVVSPFSSDVLSTLKIPGSSVASALKNLVRKDYLLYSKEEGYTIQDPLVRDALSMEFKLHEQ